VPLVTGVARHSFRAVMGPIRFGTVGALCALLTTAGAGCAEDGLPALIDGGSMVAATDAGAPRGGSGGAVSGLGGAAGGAGGPGSGGRAGATDAGGFGDAGGGLAETGRGDALEAGSSADRIGTDADGCSSSGQPSPRDPTAEAYQRDIVGRLAGAVEIAPGVRLADRANASNRTRARAYLKQLFADLMLPAEEHAYGTGSNVFALLRSTTGNAATVVLGAHFDTVVASPGANDNATGVAAVMAVARFASKLTCRAKNLLFVLFDEEEIGLVGSRRFAAKLKAEGTVVHSVHTIDQMGWDENGDRLIELEAPDPGLRELYEAAARELGEVIPMRTTNTMTTDHAAFRPTFPAIGITEGYRSGDTTPHYHKASDTFPTVNFPYLQSTTTLLNQLVAGLSR
ncbi:MAG TPA: M28 family peptidase, partial [Polyangia bacterium]